MRKSQQGIEIIFTGTVFPGGHHRRRTSDPGGFPEVYGKAAAKLGFETSAAELDSVAGGAFWGFNDKDHDECWDTYKHQENCYIVDGCDKAIKSYKGYMCARPSSCQKAYRGECNNLDYE